MNKNDRIMGNQLEESSGSCSFRQVPLRDHAGKVRRQVPLRDHAGRVRRQVQLRDHAGKVTRQVPLVTMLAARRVKSVCQSDASVNLRLRW